MHSGFAALRDICGMNIGLRIKLYDISAALTKDIDRLNELWSEGINAFGGPFLAGKEFTATDAFFAPVVFRVQTYNIKLNSDAQAYYKHMLALKGMVQWQKMALREAWRDLGHEEEIVTFGRILADHRLA
jgi:glutathione S-transferase